MVQPAGGSELADTVMEAKGSRQIQRSTQARERSISRRMEAGRERGRRDWEPLLTTSIAAITAVSRVGERVWLPRCTSRNSEIEQLACVNGSNTGALTALRVRLSTLVALASLYLSCDPVNGSAFL